MNIDNSINIANQILKDIEIEDKSLKIKMILSDVLNVEKEYLIINNKKDISKSMQKDFFKKIKKLYNFIPIEYILNKKDFMNLTFYVDKNVLIPRADTEIIINEAINIINKKHDKDNIEKEEINILDLGTGSGIIPISIANNINHSLNITAIDISRRALKIAKKNYLSNKDKLNSDICFLKSNLFNKLKKKKEFFDIIISNPPYIKTNELKNDLQREVSFEPKLALDGSQDGLKYYRQIVQNASIYLKENGKLLLEIGYDQAKDVEGLINTAGTYKDVKVIKDFSGHDRVIYCVKEK